MPGAFLGAMAAAAGGAAGGGAYDNVQYHILTTSSPSLTINGSGKLLAVIGHTPSANVRATLSNLVIDSQTKFNDDFILASGYENRPYGNTTFPVISNFSSGFTVTTALSSYSIYKAEAIVMYTLD